MQFKIIAVGKLKERAFDAKCSEFVKWLSPYAQVEVVELPDGGREKEKKEILRALEKERNSLVVIMSEEGKLMNSLEFAGYLGRADRRVVFVIGGPDGLDPEIRGRGDLLWSLSPLTFTHELARLLLLEQLYRAMSIIRGGKYHRI